MKYTAHEPNDIYYLAMGLLFATSVMAACCFQFYVRESEMREVTNCASFSSYAEMMKAFPTHPELDRNHDGRPCQDTHYKTNNYLW